MKSRKKLGLAFGGGAARGMAHIGVLEILEKNGIPVDVIAGTSIGSMIGAMYASHPHIHEVKERVEAFFQSEMFAKAKFDFLNKKDKAEGEGFFFKFSSFVRKSMFYSLSMTKRSFISEQTIQNTIAHVLDDIAIEDMPIAFAAVALDLNHGKEYAFTEGCVRKAVSASCAIPGIIAPVEFEDKLLVDGGWIEAVPVQTARDLGADVIIGVDIKSSLDEKEPTSSGLDIVFRADKITRYALSQECLDGADLVLTPDVGDIHWADFSQVEAIVEKGRVQTLENLDAIKKLLNKPQKGFFGRLLGRK